MKTNNRNALASALGSLLVLGTAMAAIPSGVTESSYQAGTEKEYPTSDAEYAARLAAAHGGTRLKWDKLPDWSGVYMRDSGGRIFSFDESAPPGEIRGYPGLTASLTPKYMAAFRKKILGIKAGKEWDRLSSCLPAGFPRWLAEPWLREFIVTPGETWMSHEQINETRRILTDGRAHVPDDKSIPLWLGDSIGFWDGDTLVVHTNHVKAGQYQRGNPDYSFKTTTVERIRKIDADVIEDRITVYDPESLLRPFHAIFHYRRVPGDARVNYASCEENNNTFLEEDGTPNERIAGEKGYRDADTFGIPEVAIDSLPK